MRRRTSLITLMGIICMIAIGLGMMKNAAEWLARGIVLSASFGLLVATLGALVRRRDRPAWTGFSLFGWGYAMVAAGVPYLTDQYSPENHFDVWRIDTAIQPIAARFHPPISEPTDPFPDFKVQRDPKTGVRYNMFDRTQTSLTPDELALQLDYEAQLARYNIRSTTGRHARDIGVTIQGVAFATLGVIAGRALSDQSTTEGTPPGTGPSSLPG